MGGEDMKTKHAFIAAHASGHAIRFMCRVLGVAHSWFHARRRATPKRTERAARRDRLGSEIREIFEQSKRCYGAPRIHAELKARGLRISKRSVVKLMRENGIRPPRRRRRAPITTDSRHSHAIAPNLLDRNFEAVAPDAVWLADISYIPTDEGWLYLAAVKDLATMEIVGWSMSERLKSVLCEEALKMAIRSRRLPMGLIHHSDRGVQYACGDYRKLLRLHGIKASMSRKGNCLDNAPMESFFGSLKTELVHRTRFSTRREARAALFEYIEIFYKPTTAPLEHRLPDAGTGQEGHDHRSGRIGEEPPGPEFEVNVKVSNTHLYRELAEVFAEAGKYRGALEIQRALVAFLELELEFAEGTLPSRMLGTIAAAASPQSLYVQIIHQLTNLQAYEDGQPTQIFD